MMAHWIKAAAAGAVGGMAAAWAMDRAQSLLASAIGHNPSAGRDELTQSQGGQRSRAAVQQGERGEPATMLAVEKAARLADAPADRRTRWLGGTALHYAFGAGVGGVYSLLAERWPATTRGAGVPFGLLVWLGAENAMAPAMGLSPPPTRSPARHHIHALFAHIVFGAVLEAIRRSVRDNPSSRVGIADCRLPITE